MKLQPEKKDHNIRNFMVTIAKINRKLKKNLVTDIRIYRYTYIQIYVIQYVTDIHIYRHTLQAYVTDTYTDIHIYVYTYIQIYKRIYRYTYIQIYRYTDIRT